MLRSIVLAGVIAAGVSARAAESPKEIAAYVESLGGQVVRAPNGDIVEISLARTWANDGDVIRVSGINTLKRLDLTHTYVTDRGIEKLQDLKLEELTLETCEFLTDASLNYLRNVKTLRKLTLRGTDMTDVGMPHLAELTGLKYLDISHSMLGDVGLESLSALAELEELRLGGNLITGMNLNSLKLLPKLKKLSFNGIQRRNAGACWSPRVTDLELDTISLLSGLEELDLGIGMSLGRFEPAGNRNAASGGNCRVTGGIQLTDTGLAKLTKLKKLRRLDVSGAKLTPSGIKALASLPIERLSAWNIPALDDAVAATLAAIPTLATIDLSYTSIGDSGLKRIAQLPRLKAIYLTDTKVTAEAVERLRKERPSVFISWAVRPPPLPTVKAKANPKPPAEF